MALLVLTVFSWVANDNRRLWAKAKVVESLDLNLIWGEGVCVVYIVSQPLCCGILPLLSGVSPSPPNQIFQVGTVPVSAVQRLYHRTDRSLLSVKIWLIISGCLSHNKCTSHSCKVNKGGFITSQLISMLFLHVPTPLMFLGIASGAETVERHEIL